MLNKCKLIQLPKIGDGRGNLTVIEGEQHIPFEIRRVYYLYDVPQDMERGCHAHKALEQLIIPISGSFDLRLDDGFERKKYRMDRSDVGIYICPMIWRSLDNFSPGSVCMVLASMPYDELDYYRDYEKFCIDLKKNSYETGTIS